MLPPLPFPVRGQNVRSKLKAPGVLRRQRHRTDPDRWSTPKGTATCEAICFEVPGYGSPTQKARAAALCPICPVSNVFAFQIASDGAAAGANPQTMHYRDAKEWRAKHQAGPEWNRKRKPAYQWSA